MTRVLVAGMGNDLCRDDGFGIVALRRYAEAGVPDGVRLYEAGIAGIGLVQELMDGYDAVIILDALDRGDAPGRVSLLEVEVPALEDVPAEERHELMADMHATLPSKALILGRSLDVLPPRVYILGCQPASCEIGIGLSDPVRAAVTVALARLQALVTELTQADARSAPPAAATMGE